MATTLKPVDAVVVGFGWTGAILAKELTEAGLNVVALERGENRDTYPDGAYPNTLDELTYNTRGKLFQNLSKSTVSIRHGINDTALPYRQLSAFLPGDGVGGAGLHWSGVHFRIMPEELRLRSHYEERYGKKFIPEGMTIQDYGVSYEELEPHFDFAEKVFGTSGTAHTVKGQVVGKGNPFAADRSDDFPLPALRQVYSAQLFRKAAEELGLHPYDLPAANASGPWTNPYGVQMGPCNFCGFCSGYACYMYSKASPNLNILPALRQTPLFELRANCNVLKVNLDSDGRQATGVTYVDAQGREIVQPAKLVIISAFQFHNVRLLLLSGIGKPYDPRTGEGVVGKNFAYQNMATIKAFFDKDVHTNPFVGTGGGGVAVDDFNADNFDHGPLGFVGGSPMWVNQAGSKPIGGLAVPPGTPSWGSGWKQAVKDAYTHTVSMDAHGSNMTYRDNYLDLDPTYKDAYGQPLLRMTFDWKDNEIRMSRYVTEHMRKIAEAMNPKAISVSVKNFGDHFNTRVYQTTHLLGGAIMGSDPKTSVLNRYLQSWDVHNVFVMGASAYPAMPYPSYARVSEADMRALYAYFMHGVEPVEQPNKASDIPWPLSMRWPLAFWRWTFAPEVKDFQAAAGQDPVLARGAYLVEGLGHCGACHTPRGLGMQEKALAASDGAAYLSGSAPLENWIAKSLRGDHRTGLGSWSEADLVSFLRTGRSERSAVFGGMSDVVVHSMQYMTDADLTAIARYLKSLPPADPADQPHVYDESVAQALFHGDDSKTGAALYVDNCGACHRTDGKGYARVFPALAGNPVVTGSDPTSLVHIVLKGGTLPATHQAPSSFTMPPFGWRMNDQEIADVVNFIRTSWGNQAPSVSVDEVRRLRKDTGAAAVGDIPPPGPAAADRG